MNGNTYVAKCSKGRGVFAVKNFPNKFEILRSPVILVSTTVANLEENLANYVFEWSKDSVAIVLGHGTLINHSPDPNLDYYLDKEKLEIYFVTTRLINPNEELTIDYGWCDFTIKPPETGDQKKKA